ncbi:hypothetical protein ACQJ0K_28590 [Priestia megaterium]|uniref:hypothetical protein n=1 Tax=Priestia megaterium TaxID=1404 RepID=UPI003CFB77BF
MKNMGNVSLFAFIFSVLFLISTYLFDLSGLGFLFIILPILGIIFGFFGTGKLAKLGIWLNIIFLILFLLLVYLPPILLGDS